MENRPNRVKRYETGLSRLRMTSQRVSCSQQRPGSRVPAATPFLPHGASRRNGQSAVDGAPVSDGSSLAVFRAATDTSHHEADHRRAVPVKQITVLSIAGRSSRLPATFPRVGGSTGSFGSFYAACGSPGGRHLLEPDWQSVAIDCDDRLAFSVFYAPPLYEAIVPYTGWSGLTNYLFTLFFAASAIMTRDRKPIYGVAMLLGLFAIFGVIGIYWHTWGPDAGRPDFGNPYLVYHPWRPVFTVALPVAWLLLLISSTMRKPKNSLHRSDGPTHGEPL